jgi:hypothetical protein
MKSVRTKAPKTNEKGEVISWDSSSPDGKALRLLFEGKLITNETARQVKKDYPRFRLYASRTLNSALSNERKRVEKEVDTQMKRGSSGKFVYYGRLFCYFNKLFLLSVAHQLLLISPCSDANSFEPQPQPWNHK